MLPKDIASDWKFDERMKWWYGDDDLVNHVVLTKGKLAIINHKATCKHEHSITMENNPPLDFVHHTLNDRFVFEQKWTN